MLLDCPPRKGTTPHTKRGVGSFLSKSPTASLYSIERKRGESGRIRSRGTMLDGTVEMDETYVGGKRKGAGFRGRGAGKEIVIRIRQRGGDLRFFHASDVKSERWPVHQREHLRSPYEHGRICVLSPEMRHHGNVAQDQRQTSSSLLGRNDVPIQPSEECQHLSRYFAP
jgi:hypothetical protein